MFYVYVLHSLGDAGLYIGFTGDLRRRLRVHQCGESFGTAFRGPWKLVYYEAYLEQADAEGRERLLKSGGGRRFLDKQLLNCFARCPRKLGQSRIAPSPSAPAA
ncbi:MAG: GIY-YIG nuclease family protein [Terrimicrobiaceae bacterium]